MVRTHQTATPLANAVGKPIHIVPGLEEVSAGGLEGRTDPAAETEYFSVLDAWVSGDLDARLAGGTSGHEFLARFDRAIAKIVERGWRTAVVFSHAGAIRTWAAIRGVNVPTGWAQKHPIPNTGIVELRQESQAWHVERWLEIDPGQVIPDAAAA